MPNNEVPQLPLLPQQYVDVGPVGALFSLISAEMQTFNAERYDHMVYRRCGRSGLMLPAISLGAWQTFGGYRDEEVARECLFRAFDLGITHFDLANNHGDPPGNA